MNHMFYYRRNHEEFFWQLSVCSQSAVRSPQSEGARL